MYDSILVATDGSDAAAAAEARAIELAVRLEVPLYAVAVLESRTAYDNAIVDPEEAERRRRERASSWLSELEERAADAGASVETAIRTGVPHEEILAYADEEDVDTVVVGARGRSSFTGSLLGSTVDGLVRSADRPILVAGGSGSD